MLTATKTPAKQSIFVTHTICCTVIVTLLGATVVVLTGLAIGLGVGLTPNYYCEDGVNCCTSDYECMQNLGYSCINSVCSCNSSYPLNSTDGTICGALNWKCSTDSDCRSSIGLTCFLSQCKCNPNQYYDRQQNRCMYLKTYGQECNNDYECNSTLRCNQPNATSTCDCPFMSSSNMCDCFPGFQYYSQDDRACMYLKNHLDSCKSSFECDSPLTCNGTNCICESGCFWNPSSYGCVAQLGYMSACTVLNDYNSCDEWVGLSCQNTTCQCMGNKYYDGNNTVCLNKKGTNYVCASNSECTSNICTSSKCV